MHQHITSTSRPFELAAMECCIVSHPYKGLDKWFTKGKEIFVVEIPPKKPLKFTSGYLNDDETKAKSWTESS